MIFHTPAFDGTLGFPVRILP